MASQRNWNTPLPCSLRVCVTAKTRSTKRKPFSLWQPKEIFRHRTRLRRALGQVVGWFHPLPADECPQRLLEPQHIGAELGGLPLGTRQPLPQQAAEPSFQRMHPAAQLSFTTHLWQRTPAPLAGLGIMMNDIQQLARRKSGGRMVQPPRLATGLPACTLLRTGRIRRGRYGGIAGFLAQLLLEVLDPLFHLLQLGDQFLDQFIRTLNISREFGP